MNVKSTGIDFRIVILTLCVIFISMFPPGLLWSQTPVQVLRGMVTDEFTGEGLPGATIELLTEHKLRATVSGPGGKFRFDSVEVGRHSIRFRVEGYADKTVAEHWVRAGKESVLSIRMEERLKLAEVVITGEKEKGVIGDEIPTVHGRNFSAEETRRYAAALDDPGRMASGFAGVQPSSDGRNDIVIRGNSPAGLLWRLEGIDIPNPNHFANPGSSGGGIAMLSSHMLANSAFLTGAFPANYGNALSGVFDLKMRKGNNEQREFSARVGALGLDFAAEGPFNRKTNGATFLANYRYSTLGLMTAIKLPVLNGAVSAYQDFACHLDFPTKGAGRFSFFAICGSSFLRNLAERDTSSWETRGDSRDETFQSGMGAVGITHKFLLPDNRTNIRTILSASLNQVGDLTDTLSAAYSPFNIFRQNFLQGRTSVTVSVSHKFDSRNFLTGGLFTHFIFFDLNSRRYDFQQSTQVTDIHSTGNSYLIQPYAAYKFRLAEKLTLDGGIHLMHLGIGNACSAEPRVSMTWEKTQGQSIGFAYGLHSQVLPLGTYLAIHADGNGKLWKPNETLGFTKSHHFVLSYNFFAANDFRIKPEIYYQHLFHVPVGTLSNPALSTLNTNWGFETDSLLSSGRGRNYGIEITLEKFFSRKYYFLITGSVYQSKYTGIDEVERNTRFNGNYAMNVLGGKEFHFGKKHPQHLELSGRTIFLGGQWATPIDLDASRLAKETVYDMAEAFAIRQKPYFRADLRLAWHLEGKRTSHSWSFDAQNAFNTKNDFVQYYDPEKDAIEQFYQAGFVPVVSWRIYF